MKKVILLAGYPATGKTYMSNVIKEQVPHAMYIAQDEVKELLYDKVGFDNLEEKDELVEFARSIFYNIVDKSIAHNEIVILDYPFSYKQIEFLTATKEKYNAQFLTLRLTGDLDVLYNRRVERDLVASRNKGHILNTYHGYESYSREDYPLTREEYKQNCINGRYCEFEFGEIIKIDVSDYAKIDYNQINQMVGKFLNEEKVNGNN